MKKGQLSGEDGIGRKFSGEVGEQRQSKRVLMFALISQGQHDLSKGLQIMSILRSKAQLLDASGAVAMNSAEPGSPGNRTIVLRW